MTCFFTAFHHIRSAVTIKISDGRVLARGCIMRHFILCWQQPVPKAQFAIQYFTEICPRESIMKMKKVKFYATLRGEGLIAALPHTPFC